MIYPLESRDESPILELTPPFTHLLLSPDGLLCKYWKQTSISRTTFSPGQIHFVGPSSESRHAHCGTPAAEYNIICRKKKKKKKNYWPTLRKDDETYVARRVVCAQHKGTTKGPMSMLRYPFNDAPWELVSIILLQLLQRQYWSRYLLVCVDYFSRHVVLAPLKDKSTKRVAHSLVLPFHYISCYRK